jgi:hypothetical protein
VATTVRHPIDIDQRIASDPTPEALARYATEKLVSQGADRLIAR